MLGSSKALATIPAVDIKRAEEFYTRVLGLSVAARPLDGVLILEAGAGTQIMVYEREATKAEHTAVTFEVKDLDRVVVDLAAKGVQFEQYDFDDFKTDERGIAQMGSVRMAWLKDPEGNLLGLGEL
jgi:catechol 2,3-dioxygenase-like lactoylglutathione lyase family enzyme